VSPRFTYTLRPFNEKLPTLLQVGTTDNKNILRLAQALKGIPCRLIILGKPSSEQISSLEENDIRFEWVAGLSSEQVVDLYRECDLVTFVSTCEGFGLPIIEGNAVGRPVITSRISSMPEVAGDAALKVDPFDVAAIREAIQAVINNSELREELVRKGLKNVERFSARTIVNCYAELYRVVEQGAR
jgi:glycosyltransferase involved in cell wall biosynthesis